MCVCARARVCVCVCACVCVCVCLCVCADLLHAALCCLSFVNSLNGVFLLSVYPITLDDKILFIYFLISV